MTDLDPKPEPAPASAYVNPAVAPAPDTFAKVAPQSGEHKYSIAEPPKS